MKNKPIFTRKKWENLYQLLREAMEVPRQEGDALRSAINNGKEMGQLEGIAKGAYKRLVSHLEFLHYMLFGGCPKIRDLTKINTDEWEDVASYLDELADEVGMCVFTVWEALRDGCFVGALRWAISALENLELGILEFYSMLTGESPSSIYEDGKIHLTNW